MMNRLVVVCPKPQDTMNVAEKLSRQLKGGEVIELSGDLGAGKTTFVKGLARGLSSKDKVSSPSFALKNLYEGRLNLYHFDLYRLEQPGLMNHELEEAINEGSVVAIEWAGSSSELLPANRISVEFVPEKDEARKLKITYPDGER